MKNNILAILSLLMIASCSIQSSQYNFIKNIALNEENNRPEKNWTSRWLNKNTDLYAINIKDQIIFADEKINIFFKDDQIYKVTGLLENDAVIEIEKSDNRLSYKINGIPISSDYCSAQSMLDDNKGFLGYTQSCEAERQGVSYRNQILLDSNNLITSLIFKIHPNYPQLKLRKK